MSLLRRKAAGGFSVLLAVGIIVGAGSYLSSTQATARQSVLREFDQRAQLAAGLVGDTLLASDSKTRQWATTSFAGAVAGLNAALAQATDASTPWLTVLDTFGAPIGVSSASHRAQAATLRSDSGFRQAVRSAKLAFGDVDVENGIAMVYAFQPYAAGQSSRVLVVPMAAENLGPLLRTAAKVAGSRSYIVDRSGRLVVTSTNARIGATLGNKSLVSAAERQGRGTVNDDYFVSTPVSGSGWRAIVVTSRTGLLAPLNSTARSGWLIFGGFVVAVLLTLVIGASTLISSARLAHARRHDPLTGLPNRSLFLEQAEAAVTRWRRQENSDGDQVAALFLDLDGFKPVNDTYGHAAGDALLQAVAQRLVGATRPEDYVSRFGGDEFLVLCRGLHDESDAVTVAERIRKDLTQPYDVLGQHVLVGTSIGVAVLGEHADRVETLINNADLALYRAKDNGRGRIETYTPDLESVSN